MRAQAHGMDVSGSMRRFTITIAILVACGKPASGPGRQEPGKPVETQAPNAGDQEPAFTGQTRAPYRTAGVPFDTQVVARALEHPWSVAFLPEGDFLVTERPGRLRMVARDGTLSPPLEGVPRVDARDQGGLLDVLVDPEGVVFLSYAEPRDGGNGTAVARGRLDRERMRLEDVRVIWRMTPTLDSTKHFGSRLVLARDGTLFITTGERSIDEGRHQSQKLDSAFGKVIRINRDGTTPADNPFRDRSGVLPQIYSYGHRNVQAAALHPLTGKLWVVDHGARGGDEIDIVEPGKNYGWPVIAYGIEYKGDKIGAGLTAKPGMEQPIYYWDPVIAPSGAAFYEGPLFPAWRGNLFVGALAGKHVARLTLDTRGDRVVGEERLLADRGKRVRDVRVGPDGALYVLTDEADGELLRLAPREGGGTVSGR
jgi:glucose/arabinose dehydrogenase